MSLAFVFLPAIDVTVLYFNLLGRPSQTQHLAATLGQVTMVTMKRGSIWASNLEQLVSAKDFTGQVSTCARCQQWRVALSLLATLPSRRLRPNVVMTTAAMAAGEGWQRAMELLQKMLVEEIPVNSIAFNAVPGWFMRTLFVGMMKPDKFSSTKMLVELLLCTCTGNPGWCLLYLSFLVEPSQRHCRSRPVVVGTPKK